MIKITKNFKISCDSEPKIIAEISGNHGGSKKRFLELIKSACLNGADLIKITATGGVMSMAKNGQNR